MTVRKKPLSTCYSPLRVGLGEEVEGAAGLEVQFRSYKFFERRSLHRLGGEEGGNLGGRGLFGEGVENSKPEPLRPVPVASLAKL